MLKKLLIANRGEIALRIIRACREMEIESVIVYSDADSDSLPVRLADEAVNIGPPPASKSYLRLDAILDAATKTEADAVHPGYGFLAENAAFAQACEEAGLNFIGPTSEVIKKIGDKSAARDLAKVAEVPLVPGTEGGISPDEATKSAREIGYPVMVKAAAGGGGRGIRIVHSEADLKETVRVASREAESAFGDGSVYLERFLTSPRHVEVQILGDKQGNIVHLFERECSMQRRRQKVLEEAPAPSITNDQRRSILDSAVKLAQKAGYTSAGTVEFLVDEEAFYFIEMNTRVQVEHPITEMITGVDLIKAQIRIANNERLDFDQDQIIQNGCAIEFRINAEDPEKNFMPSPGRISYLEVPGGPGVRVDSAIYDGYTIPPFYDSMIGKLIVWGCNREEAISRAKRALNEYRIEGLKTTITLHLRLLTETPFLSGQYDTKFLENLLG